MASEQPESSAERLGEQDECKAAAEGALNRNEERGVESRTRERLRSTPRPANVPPPPSDPLPEDAIENIPKDAKPLMQRLKREKKKDKNPTLIAREESAHAAIAPYLQELRDELKERQRVEDFRKGSNTYYREVFKKIDAMLAKAQSDGLVVRHNGRLTNRIGYVSPWIDELNDMLLGEKDPFTGNHKGSLIVDGGQREYIGRVRAFFQTVKDGDKDWAQVYDHAMKNVRPQSQAVRKGKDALKMLGFLVVGGVATWAGLMDLKAGTLSPYTVAWLGLTGYAGGLFTGHDKVVRRQLTFVTTPEWERLRAQLNLKGKGGVDFIDSIRKAHEGKRGAEARKLLKAGRQKREIPAEQNEDYIRAIVGKQPQGQDAYVEKLLNNLTEKQLYLLGSSLMHVRDGSALALLHDFTEYDVHSGSVARDVKAARQKNPPSASAPSGTPPARLPQ